MSEPVYVTRGLLEALLSRARETDPGELSLALGSSRAGGLEGPDAGLAPPEARVFTDVYVDGGGSIEAVFGVELGLPPGSAHGRFLTHPDGRLEVTRTDDLAPRVLVAVPPWEPGDVAAFDRSGRRHRLEVLDAAPPERALE